MHPAARLLALCCTCTAACGAPAEKPPGLTELPQPELVRTLPPDLAEASGITVLDADRLGLVDDERGILFILAASSGAIVAARRFAEDGDYEDVASAGSRVFVLRSDGFLAEIEDWRAASPRVTRHSLDVGPACDAEGLTFDPARKELLVACRGGRDRERAIHALSIAGGPPTTSQGFRIDLDTLARFSAARGRQLPVAAFQPSAIAIDAGSGELYVLSSASRTIAVLDRTRALRHMWLLPRGVLQQPEGIAVGPGGRLWICGEAGTRPGVMALWRVPQAGAQ